jgi:hypothetical protein
LCEDVQSTPECSESLEERIQSSISKAVDKIMQLLNENTIGKLLHLANRYLVEQPLWKLAVGTQGMSCKKNFICP